jgi:hypothetical protein
MRHLIAEVVPFLVRIVMRKQKLTWLSFFGYDVARSQIFWVDSTCIAQRERIVLDGSLQRMPYTAQVSFVLVICARADLLDLYVWQIDVRTVSTLVEDRHETLDGLMAEICGVSVQI